MPLELGQIGEPPSLGDLEVYSDFDVDSELADSANQSIVTGAKAWEVMVADTEQPPHTNTSNRASKLAELDENFQ